MKNWIMAILLLALPAVAYSGNPTHSIDLTCCSYHFDRDKDFNEQNLGLEYKYFFKPDFRLSLAVYDNSEYNTTVFVGVGYHHPVTKNIDFTLEAGLLTGYETAPLMPVVAPGLSFYDRVHFRITPVVIGASVTLFKW